MTVKMNYCDNKYVSFWMASMVHVVIGSMLILAFVLGSSAAWAKTIEAGTQLGTRATASYTVGGAKGTDAISNDVVTLVRGVDAVLATAGSTEMSVAANMSMNVPFTIKNTGNQTSTFKLDVAIDNGGSYSFFWDKNHNLIPDAGEAIMNAGNDKNIQIAMNEDAQFVVILPGIRKNESRTVTVAAQPLHNTDSKNVSTATTKVTANDSITFGVSLKGIDVQAGGKGGTKPMDLNGEREVSKDDVVTIIYSVLNQNAHKVGYLLFAPDKGDTTSLKLDVDATIDANDPAKWALNPDGLMATQVDGAQRVDVKVVYKVMSDRGMDVVLRAQQAYAALAADLATALTDGSTRTDVLPVDLKVKANATDFTVNKVIHAVGLFGRQFIEPFTVSSKNLGDVPVELSIDNQTLPAGAQIEILNGPNGKRLLGSSFTMKNRDNILAARVTLPAGSAPLTDVKFAIKINAEHQKEVSQNFEISEIKVVTPAMTTKDVAPPAGFSLVDNQVEVALNLTDGLTSGDATDNPVVEYRLSNETLPAGIKSVQFYDATDTPLSEIKVGIAEIKALKVKIIADDWFVGDKTVKLVSETATGLEHASLDIKLVSGSQYSVTFGPTAAEKAAPAGVTTSFTHMLTNAGSPLELAKVTFAASSVNGWAVDVELLNVNDGKKYQFSDSTKKGTFILASPASGISIDSNATNWTLVVGMSAPLYAASNDSDEVTLQLGYGKDLLNGSVVHDKLTVSTAINSAVLSKAQALARDGSSCSQQPADTDFSETAKLEVAPGACVWYRLTLENQGSQPLENIVITDRAQNIGALSSLEFQNKITIFDKAGDNSMTANGDISVSGEMKITVTGKIAADKKAVLVYPAKMQDLPSALAP